MKDSVILYCGTLRGQQRPHPARFMRTHKTRDCPGLLQAAAGTRFSTEDLNTLYRLEVAYAGDPRIASRIARSGEMPGFTAKQISDKRKEAAYQRCRDQYLAAHQQDARTPDSSSASSDGGGPSPPPTPVRPARLTDSPQEKLIQPLGGAQNERPDTPQSVGEVPAGGSN